MSTDQSRGTGSHGTPSSTSFGGLPRWVWGLAAVAAAIPVYTTYRMVESSGQLAVLERERVSLIQDKGRLDAALVAARKQVDELKSLQTAAETEIKKSRDDAKAASTQVMQVQERVKALEAELGGAKGIAASVQSDSDKLRQDVASANKAKADAEAKAAGLERELAALSARLADMSQKYEEAQRKLQAAPGTAPPKIGN